MYNIHLLHLDCYTQNCSSSGCRKQCHSIIIKLIVIYIFVCLFVRILPRYLLLLICHELDQNRFQRVQKKWFHFLHRVQVETKSLDSWVINSAQINSNNNKEVYSFLSSCSFQVGSIPFAQVRISTVQWFLSHITITQ